MFKIAAFWNSLPHLVQAGIVAFVSAGGGVLAKSIEAPQACMSTSCWGTYIQAGLHAGIAGVIALYVPSSLGKH